ncbi:hypothetical protein Mal4_05930 [Maioricimonas rarisocia]|uniref:Secondary thiamine-phosphate synthase enzyme n=2 Tax=Maioricimonas rarisocia TaxID=2528026 RepID=A0A517Z1G6_9PLAN|nr:hypothetical protein Mal4_05930 [Maioricimonas rarisocia]
MEPPELLTMQRHADIRCPGSLHLGFRRDQQGDDIRVTPVFKPGPAQPARAFIDIDATYRSRDRTDRSVNSTAASRPPLPHRARIGNNPITRRPCRRSFRMKSQTEYLTFNIPARMDFLNITPTVERIVRESGVQEGLVLANAMHITASVFINDDESGLHSDYKKWLEDLAPFDASPQRYAHNRTGEDNADAHMKRQVMGREVVVAITEGKLDFGPWEQIFYGEFDGRRPKRVLVKVIGE